MTAVVQTSVGPRFARQVAAVSLLPWLVVLVVDRLGVATDVGVFAALVLVGTMHVGTTAAVYFDREARPLITQDRARFVAGPVALIVVGIAAAWWAPEPVFAVLVAGRIMWQVHHFNRQNLGMISMRAKAQSQPGLDGGQRRALDLAGWGAMLATLATYEEWLPTLARIVDPAQTVILIGSVGLLAVAGVMAFRSDRPLELALAVVYWLPLVVFHNRPAVAVLAIGLTHAAQYYYMMFGLRGGRSTEGTLRIVLIVALCAVTIGAYHANIGVTPFQHDAATGVGYGLFFGMGAAHFLIDAGMWRMRAAAPRAYLRERFAFL